MPFLKKLLVVEDEDAVAHLIEAWLGDAGYLCLRARDGEEALATIRKESPDLIILDVLMPKLDGLEVVRRIKADPVLSGVPVLMLTALHSIDDRVRGLDAGADDYLSKPFDMRELLARCQSLLRHNRRERDRSPVTGLPGPQALEAAIAARVESKAPFALVFLELDGFDQFVAEAGWRKGEGVVREVANQLAALAPLGTVDGSRPVVLTHLGGDDFVLVGDPAAMAELNRDAPTLVATSLPLLSRLVDAKSVRSWEEVAALVAKANKSIP